MDNSTIFLILFTLFCMIDSWLYLVSPLKVRMSLPWWRYLPGGGIITYILTMRREKKHGN